MIDATRPVFVEADNLSIGWAKIMAELMRPGRNSISPLTLSITGFDDSGRAGEIAAIRTALDEMLLAIDKRDCENVAFTIFPQRYWEMTGGNRQDLYEMYDDAFDRIQKMNSKNNKRGSYFDRLIDFNGEGRGPNQLEWILNEHKMRPGTRRSKWQATTFDPIRDNTTTPYQEFPCLQQISFTFSESEGLILNGFYATQQIVRKAYGNYLGLSRLGAFMAHEMHLRFERLNVFVGVAQADTSKGDPAMQTLMTVVNHELQMHGRSQLIGAQTDR
jgi:hypothetical protein